jgi:cell division septal protein FtsQ
MTTSKRPQAYEKQNSQPAESQHFRRKEGQVHTKKIHRKIKVQFRHIFLSFIFLVGFFLVLQQVFLFAISWDKLDIKNVYISCDNQAVKNEIQDKIEDYSFGNILLFDSQNLQKIIGSLTKVKNVTIKKIFPLSLNILIEERKPFAVLRKEFLFLIDTDGVIVSQLETPNIPLPLLIDENNFKDYYREKIDLARECLENMTPEERQNIEILDLSENLNVKIKTRDSSTWLVLGYNRFVENFRRFLTEKTYLERYGDLEYVDLRFQDRFFIKPLKDYSIKDMATSAKEAN